MKNAKDKEMDRLHKSFVLKDYISRDLIAMGLNIFGVEYEHAKKLALKISDKKMREFGDIILNEVDFEEAYLFALKTNTNHLGIDIKFEI